MAAEIGRKTTITGAKYHRSRLLDCVSANTWVRESTSREKAGTPTNIPSSNGRSSAPIVDRVSAVSGLHGPTSFHREHIRGNDHDICG